ncbi:hypothetical protein INR49_018917 [Caranx melampygus]|nr:hypothetical protein INR49_018917 [Caranx melampygus]
MLTRNRIESPRRKEFSVMFLGECEPGAAQIIKLRSHRYVPHRNLYHRTTLASGFIGGSARRGRRCPGRREDSMVWLIPSSPHFLHRW